MLSVRGTYENGIARPDEPISGRDGQAVIITFLNEPATEQLPVATDAAWEALKQLIEAHAVETGIPDLAHQHDHYLYGKPKRQ
ncbi:MAG: hypothetical protein M5U01_17900 [Ardenticatenaceae bacterium]|nr:hypothetical protein [Ardenticatenaceae bacterium]HBY97231.1 hypothetical protein [Chloroflexota bacterium]